MAGGAGRLWLDHRPRPVYLGTMQIAVTLVSPDPAAAEEALVRAAGALAIASRTRLGLGAEDLLLETGDVMAMRPLLDGLLQDLPVDVCVQPAEGRRKRLLVADMDSTIISCECLDELADFAGVKAAVSAITERAMRGELNFESALRERVGMLKGLPVNALQDCYDQRVRLNPGARTLIATMGASGAKCLLVSGGFTFFTGRVAAAAGFAGDRANRLIEADGLLTGAVAEPILGKAAKLSALREEAAILGLEPSATLAIGDGANDLAMIEAAGLGIAYRAKPIVAAQAHARIDHADLTALLYFQGYPSGDFVA
jgi:phosphoserine phosphatase